MMEHVVMTAMNKPIRQVLACTLIVCSAVVAGAALLGAVAFRAVTAALPAVVSTTTGCVSVWGELMIDVDAKML